MRVSAPNVPATNARGITQDLVELAGFLVANLLAADDRDRLRRLHDRRVGLGARHRAAGDVTLDRAAWILDDGGCWRLAFRLGSSGDGRALVAGRRLRRVVVAAVRFSGDVTTTDGRGCDAEPEFDCANDASGHNANTDAVADAATPNKSRNFKASPQPASTCRAFRKLGSATPVGTHNAREVDSSNGKALRVSLRKFLKISAENCSTSQLHAVAEKWEHHRDIVLL